MDLQLQESTESAARQEDDRIQERVRMESVQRWSVKKEEVMEGQGEPVLTLQDVCRLLSISKATAKNWIRLGRITPDRGEQQFSAGYLESLVRELESEGSTRLKNRRNKKYTAGKVLYKDYIPTEDNQRLAAELLESGIIASEEDLRMVLANFAVQLYSQSREISCEAPYVLRDVRSWQSGEDFLALVRELMGKAEIDPAAEERLYPAFSKKIRYVRGEDSLGLIYLSLQDMGGRKSAGAYYTPERVVDELIRRLEEEEEGLDTGSICDPCCGTGNFLLRLGLRGVKGECLYGQDRDPISVMLARINLALMCPELSAEELRTRLRIGNTYLDTFARTFDVVLGNPPWGSDLTEEEIHQCRRMFRTAASGQRIEAYALFVEKALTMLRPGGRLAFVLPEAVLGVAAHNSIRQLILASCSIRFVTYLGNVFSGVQCPAILLGLTADPGDTMAGCRVIRGNTDFVITGPRTFEDGTLRLHLSDEEYQCLEAIRHVEQAVFLKDHADFALGIVTGNNQKYLSREKREDNEAVLKGSDLGRYEIRHSGHYICFRPESFQQTAPVELYRAKEKLLYRFISEVPVFAYDNRQMLSLNSCNILIPRIRGLEIKYILAILNSSVAAYFISRRFRSVKLLRSHLEQMPIPVMSAADQQSIIQKVDSILCAGEDRDTWYERLDREIMDLYGLSRAQREQIREAGKGSRPWKV